MLVDSGSPVCLLPERVFRQLAFSQSLLQKTDMDCSVLTGHDLYIIGCLLLDFRI